MKDNRLVQQAGIEMIAIVISVLLALFLSNWWQQRELEENHEKTLVLVEAELRGNETELNESIAYYKAIIPKLAAVLVDGVTMEEAKETLGECCALMTAGTGRTSHEMAVITGLYSSLEPSVAADIISAFVGQEDLRESMSFLTEGVMEAADINDPEEFLGRYYIYASSIEPSMEELLEVTQTAITTIEALE